MKEQRYKIEEIVKLIKEREYNGYVTKHDFWVVLHQAAVFYSDDHGQTHYKKQNNKL